MKALSERIKDFPAEQFVDWLCLACVDVREVRTPDAAQEEIDKIRAAVTERLSALEQRAEAAEEWVKTAERTMDYQAGVITDLGVRAEAAEAKLAELEKQEPVAWISSGEHAILSRLKKHAAVEVGLFNVQRFSDDTPLFTSSPIPTGWKVVPIEPTERMVIAGFESEPDEDFSEPDVWEEFQMMSGCQQAAYKARLCWSAMIDAAPTPKE